MESPTQIIFYCYYCNFEAIHKNTLRHHIVRHLHSKIKMRNSLACHPGNSKIQSEALRTCDVVPNQFPSTDFATNQSGHLYSGEKPYSYAKSNQSEQLKMRMKTHSGRNLDTDGTFDSLERGSLTKRVIHYINGLDNNLMGDRCSQRDNNSKQSSNLKKDISSEKKLYSCSFCEFTCKQAGDLKRHLRVHTGEKPYTCSLCDYATSRSGYLKTHMMIHTGEKPYTCTFCDFTAKQTGDLKRHLMVHTGEKPFSCTQCDFTTNQLGTLKRHSLIHTGLKPYSCSLCNFTTRQTHSLKRHMSRHKQ